MKILRLFFSFYGRTNRSMYWVGMGVVYAMFALNMVVWSSFPSETENLVAGLLAMPLLVSLFALVAKRLHDLGFSAWWWIGANAALFVSILLRSGIAEQIMTTVIGGGMILIGFFKSASGPNRFADLSEIASPR